MKRSRELRVLYSTYPTAFQMFGGAEIQLLKTKDYLEKLGSCSIKLFDMFNDRVDQYDILHNFSMHRDCENLCGLAKQKGLKVALSPIYWRSPMQTGGFAARWGPLAFARLYFNLKQLRIPTFRELTPFKYMLESADIILPNSRMEAAILSSDFRVDYQKFWVVPNAVDERFALAKPDIFVEKYGLEDFIIFVGRIEPIKNVLTLVKACQDLKLPLIVAGYYNPGEENYFMMCQRIAQSSKNIRFIGFLPHTSEELLSAYAAAKVFVLPSWFETTGLSALEAGLAGCNVVITFNGATTEYFKDHVWYVNPASIEDIKMKILQAYEKQKNSELKNHILANYTWEKTAKRTLEAYNLILNKS